MNLLTKSIWLNGKEISLETGKIARQADGSVILRMGETVLLATACRGAVPSANTDFLPLRVDYQARMSSTGRSLGGFIKREGKPSEKEILTSRFIDRSIRPMFVDGFYNEVQVLVYVLSYDGVHSPEPLALTAASAALVLSDIPLVKPVGAVQVGFIENEFVINPSPAQMEKSRLDLILAGTEEALLMIEGYADFLTEEQILEAVQTGHAAIKTICQGLAEWQTEIGKEKYLDEVHLPSDALLEAIEKLIRSPLEKAFQIKEKGARSQAIDETKTKVLEHFNPEKDPSLNLVDILKGYKMISEKVMKHIILTEKRRVDGRKVDEVRPIHIDMHLLPRTHGSALFTRGETQSIAVCTLGGESMGQRFEDLHGDKTHKFYLQYFFPPFSVGEVGKMGAPGRREVGHGKLAERALAASLPENSAFPYVIRLESTITESNGSSSMASVCGGTLALMDAGVPLKHPIAGIAMGLILEGDQFVILSDILGDEDALGDMDFKVAGNAHGITAFQLDIKVEGITYHIMEQALAQAKQGRLHILHKMLEACPKSKTTLSQYAPRIETIQVKPSKIGTIIGPGGKQIRAIMEESGAQVDIADSGVVSISATSSESMEIAKRMIINLVSEVEIGKTYEGVVVKIVDFGAFVRIFDKDGLCHISELDHARINHASDLFKEGDVISVKVLDINPRGQIKLSRRATLSAPQGV